MTYNIIAVRTAEDADGSLYPVVGDDRSPIEIEKADGNTQHLVGSGLGVRELVNGKLQTLARVRDVKIDILITDARMAVACEKFDKGGGWVGFGGGAAVFALAANGVSKALAARRRRGKMLLGHVRYPWLTSVGFKPKQGWGSVEELRLGVIVKAGEVAKRQLMLDVALPKNIDSAAVAQSIAKRAASYWLANVQIDDPEEKANFQSLANARRLDAPQARTFALYRPPRYYFVSAASANQAGPAHNEAGV